MTHSGKKWKVVFNTNIYSDLVGVDKYVALKIKTVINERLTTSPDLYGVPLRKSLRNLRKLRIGDFRVVYHITGNTVLVVGIGHRKNIYETIKKRFGL